MGLIPEDIIDEIRQRADIAQVIGRHVKLRKAGQNHKGLCPFHQEKSPSFNVNADKGFFYCFGCQKKGDVFTFVMEYEGRSFLEAAEMLAELSGVTLPERSDDPRERRALAEARTERSHMYRLNQLAAEFFQQRLGDPGGGAARAYLEERGTSQEIAHTFGLGYAPDAWADLTDWLSQRGADLKLAEAVGLIAPRKRGGGHYDRFRHRLVCPVVLATGEVVGFSARALGGAKVTAQEGSDPPAKYINSPESAIYKKSKLLYGLHQAHAGIRSQGRVVLVEGNFDVISLHQAGVTSAVAPLGTALTEDQVQIMRRLAERAVLLYDGDRAGRAATLKALRVCVAAGTEVEIVALPPGEDPDSFAKSHSQDEIDALFAKGRPAVEYFIEHVWSQTDRSAAAYSTALHEAAALLPAVKDPLRRNHLVDHLAGSLGVGVQRLRSDLRAAYRGQKVDGPPQGAPNSHSKLPPPPTEELDLLAYLAEFPELLPVAESLDVLSLLTDSRLRDMYSAAAGGQPIWSSPHEVSPEIAAHVLTGAKKSVAHPENALREAAGGLKTRRATAARRKLLQELQQAERRRDDDLGREMYTRGREIRQPKE